MKRFFKNCHLPENLEVLFMLILGILLQMADGSPFSLKQRWILVWETELPAENFSPFVQKCIKTLLSMIVVVRCATTYAYVVSAMLVIFCLLRNTAPKLMLLWLLIAGVKSVLMTFLEALTGVYVCSAFGKIRKACIEFFISKALEIIFATYLWGNVLNIYQDMERKAEIKKIPPTKEQLFMQRTNCGRQRTRSMVDESTLYKTACLNNFEFKDVPQIILQMLRRGMSQDSLLGPDMMLASVSNLGSFDNLKTSQSLGELGFVDLGNTEVIGLEEDENLSHKEKALRFLKLTKSEALRIRKNKTSVENDIYTIDTDIWTRVKASGTHINKPKQARTQVFIRDISQLEPCYENSVRDKMRKKSKGFSFSNLLNEKQSAYDEEQDDEFIFSLDEDEEDEQSMQMIMSNLKEGVIISRNKLGIVPKKKKGNAYAELYRKDFMSMIGPELFDRDCKLPKVTSVPKLNSTLETKTSASLPAMSELKSEDSKISKDTSSEELQQSNPEDLDITESSSGEKTKSNLETDSTEEENSECLPHDTSGPKEEQEKSEIPERSEPQGNCSETTSQESFSSVNLSSSDNCQEKIPKLFRKRRIIIRRIGKRKKLFNSSSDLKKSSENSEPNFDLKSKTQFERKDAEVHKESEKADSNYETSHLGINYDGQTPFAEYNKQIYFLTELLQKPLLDVLLTYYELKKRVYVQEKPNAFFENSKREFFSNPLQNYRQLHYKRIFETLDFSMNNSKVWKSRVLKTAEARSRENSTVGVKTIENIINTEAVLRRLHVYKHARLMHVNNNFFQSDNENFVSPVIKNEADLPYSNASSVVSDPTEAKNTVKLKSGNSFNRNAEKVIEVCHNEEEKNSVGEKPPEGEPKSEILIADVEKSTTESPDEATDYTISEADPERESICSQESDEPISLYYSKAANLASPLFDMKRFIYPDHIHYSYKHVKKKGFDVDINGGFPLLMRESLTMGTPVKMGNKLISKKPEFEITRRPMDLSFATTNAFAEWQNNDQNDVDVVVSEESVKKFNNSNKKEQNSFFVDFSKNKKAKKTKRTKRNEIRSSSKIEFNKMNSKQYDGNFNNIKYLYSTKDYELIEKLLKMHAEFNSKEFQNMGKERKPVQISSTQLHSNKGRINSTYNPAIILQENKNRNEKKKIETQEERTKDMFARLEREALLQSKNVQKSFGSNGNTRTPQS